MVIIKVLDIKNNCVYLGNEGRIEEFLITDFNYVPKIGDEVEIYKNDQSVISIILFFLSFSVPNRYIPITAPSNPGSAGMEIIKNNITVSSFFHFLSCLSAKYKAHKPRNKLNIVFCGTIIQSICRNIGQREQYLLLPTDLLFLDRLSCDGCK